MQQKFEQVIFQLNCQKEITVIYFFLFLVIRKLSHTMITTNVFTGSQPILIKHILTRCRYTCHL